MAFALEGPTLIEVEQGKSATATIRVLATSRPYRNVSLRITGLPSGVTAGFSPSSGKPSYQSTLTLVSFSTSATGTFTLTITARDAKGTKTMPVVFRNYTVNIPPAPPPPGEPPFTADVWVAKEGDGGSDSNDGLSVQTPKLTIVAGIGVLNSIGSAGKKMAIKQGTYNEDINSNSITIPSGNNWSDAPVICSFPNHTVILQTGMNLVHSYIQYLIFQDLIFDGSVGKTNNLTNANHVRFLRGEFKNYASVWSSGQNAIILGPESPTQTFHEFIDVVFHDNRASPTDARGHGIYMSSSNNLVDGCIFYNNGGFQTATGNPCLAMQIYSATGVPGEASNNTVRNCIFHDNGGSSGGGGLLLGTGSGNDVYNNIFYSHPHTDGALGSCCGVSSSEIYNNTFYNNVRAIGALNAIIRNNIFWQNTTNVEDFGGNTINTNTTTDPHFVDQDNANFHLTSSSTDQINQGATIGLVTNDFDGVSRPQGVAYDIGAFEFQS